MSQGTFQGIATILAMVAFLGVCWWAFSSHKKKDFEEAAQLPFADEDVIDDVADDENDKSSTDSEKR